MDKQKKIQELLIKHLLEEGHIELKLPDNFVLEIGIVQEGKDGTLVKQDNYCWVIASQGDRTIAMDSYNFDLRFSEKRGKIVVDDITLDHDGDTTRVFTVI